MNSRDDIARIASRWHSAESGAVALLAIVALMILLFLAWTLYDAGFAARDKLKVQAAADTAAFSQAAIRARSMNMIAYTNISKRSIWGVHSLYPAYLKSTYDYIRYTVETDCAACSDPTSEECKRCTRALKERDRWIQETCSGERCGEIFGPDPAPPEQWGVFRHLQGNNWADAFLELNSDGTAITDLQRFDPANSGSVASPPEDPNTSLVYKRYGPDIRALANYQRYIYGLTPWWGWTEQLVRATRSGATMSSSWPPPVGTYPFNIAAVLHNIFTEISSLYSSFATASFSGHTDSLPVYPAQIGTMRDHIWQAVDGSWLGITVINCVRAAIPSIGGSCDLDGVDPFLVEHLVNGIILTLKSRGIVAFEQGLDVGECGPLSLLPAPACIHYDALLGDAFLSGLRYTENSFRNILGDPDLNGGRRDHIDAEPWLLRPQENEGLWSSSTSNIVLTYKTRFGINDADEDRQKFDMMRDYKGTDVEEITRRSFFYGDDNGPATGVDLLRQEATYNASGQWAMARGEVTFVGGDPDLWHPSWTARLRPIVLPFEFQEAGYSLNQVYRDTLSGFVLAAFLGVTSLSDVMVAIADLAYMDKATLAIADATAEGVAK